MSVFNKIKDALFGRHAPGDEVAQGGVNTSAGPAPVPASTPVAAPGAPQSTPSGAAEARTNTPPAASAPAATAGGPAAGTASSATNGASTGPVDVEAVMDKAAKASGQKLDWRHSIVDMMKALGLDSSVSERRELAQELGYTGDTGDSAAMNIWLHKALLRKLAENGGKVPADLTD